VDQQDRRHVGVETRGAGDVPIVGAPVDLHACVDADADKSEVSWACREKVALESKVVTNEMEVGDARGEVDSVREVSGPGNRWPVEPAVAGSAD
jgi:hypothetical protein